MLATAKRTETAERYRAIGLNNVEKLPEWTMLPPEVQEAVRVVSQILPFRTNAYVVRNLIDWNNIPEDPIFQLTFPQRDMLQPEYYQQIKALLDQDASRQEVTELANHIRYQLNPHPAGQLTHNVPELDGKKLHGIQHKYRETMLLFPGQGQTCHAYCTYCFRWAQFVGLPEIKFEARETEEMEAYLRAHHEISDVLVTGGDPLIMKTKVLRKYLEPLLKPEYQHVQNLRLGTKSLAYWPQRFVSDSDADDVLRLMEQFVRAGKHVAVMAHFTHPVELSTDMVREAIRRIRMTGAQIRMQAPLVKHVNDTPEAWAEMWREGVRLGLIPYYMFVERDTGPKNYFEVPLVKAHQVFHDAYNQVSGLARTVRGPSMSAFPGKVRVLGVSDIHGEKVFVLDLLQGRDPDWVRQPFFAKFDEKATWLTDLDPAFGEERFFFENDEQVERRLARRLPQ